MPAWLLALFATAVVFGAARSAQERGLHEPPKPVASAGEVDVWFEVRWHAGRLSDAVFVLENRGLRPLTVLGLEDGTAGGLTLELHQDGEVIHTARSLDLPAAMASITVPPRGPALHPSPAERARATIPLDDLLEGVPPGSYHGTFRWAPGPFQPEDGPWQPEEMDLGVHIVVVPQPEGSGHNP